jgi:hypothetical protein
MRLSDKIRPLMLLQSGDSRNPLHLESVSGGELLKKRFRYLAVLCNRARVLPLWGGSLAPDHDGSMETQ